MYLPQYFSLCNSSIILPHSYNLIRHVKLIVLYYGIGLGRSSFFGRFDLNAPSVVTLAPQCPPPTLRYLASSFVSADGTIPPQP